MCSRDDRLFARISSKQRFSDDLLPSSSVVFFVVACFVLPTNIFIYHYGFHTEVVIRLNVRNFWSLVFYFSFDLAFVFDGHSSFYQTNLKMRNLGMFEFEYK